MPERELDAAILGQALEDIGDPLPEVRREVATWFADSRTHSFGSFLFICEELGLDARGVRRHAGVVAMRAALPCHCAIRESA